MPTVLRAGRFTVRIYTQDHAPAHVHVVHGNGNLKVYLETERDPELRGSMRPADVRRAVALVSAHYDDLLGAWRRIHSKP